MRAVIINADDFGIDESVNLGIIKGHLEGVVSSTTIMASGKAFMHAVELAKSSPKLGVGVHLTLVNEKPIAPYDRVKSLIDADGRMPSEYGLFLRNFLMKKIDLGDIGYELEMQVKRVIDAGIVPTHLDSHQHLHVFPGIIDIVLELGKKFNIKVLRIPGEGFFYVGGYPFTFGRLVGRSGLTFLARLARRKAARQGFLYSDNFFGMLAGNCMKEPYLLRILEDLPQGSSEIMMHPGISDSIMTKRYGWRSNWQAELAAATSQVVKNYIVAHDIKLTTFRDLRYV